MSGLEVAGVVLGASPLAIEALDKYREVARRLGFWYKIRLEYQKCSDNLTYYQLAYKRHLKLLLLPLIVDDDKIRELLTDPGGDGWKDVATAELLKSRLDESYGLYLRHMATFAEIMQKLKHELAVDQESVQKAVTTSKGPIKTRVRYATTKDGMEYHLYKIKFSNGAAVRKELFAELKDLLERLRDILDTSDEETRLVNKRLTIATSSAIDAAVCSFFIRANKLFRALSSAWKCCCQQQHCVHLLLRHRTDKKSEFEIMFAKASQTSWDISQTRIIEGDDITIEDPKQLTESTRTSIITTPAHRDKQPIKSALRTKPQVLTTGMKRRVIVADGCREHKAYTIHFRAVPSITLKTTPISVHQTETPPITSLCLSLGKANEPCCGFLMEENSRYYVYKLFQMQSKSLPTMTLDEILRGKVQPVPTRRQRYSLALTLASSFLQLLETPWLPANWSKPDIIFTGSVESSGVSALSQPHLSPDLASPGEDKKVGTFLQSLDLLGIVLLELCFGILLENHACRGKYPPGSNDAEKIVFDFMAARDWQVEVNEEAGPDFSAAVGWCLGGYRITPREVWRREMLLKVVRPLERCGHYLSGGTADHEAS